MNPVRALAIVVTMQIAFAYSLLAHAAEDASGGAMGLYDRIQSLRPQEHSLLAGDDPPRENVLRAERELTQAWAITQQPSTRELAEGNIFLSMRRFDVARDMAEVQALLGRKQEAMDWLDSMMSVAWIGASEFVDELLIKNPHFASLQGEPRFRAILATLAATNRLQRPPGTTIPYSTQIGEAERIAGLSMFWSEVRAGFVHFDLVPDLDWNQVYLDTLPKVIAAGSTAEYYDILMRLAPQLHDGHTNIYPPEELRARLYARPPLRTALVDGHVAVTRVRSASLEKLGIQPTIEVKPRLGDIRAGRDPVVERARIELLKARGQVK
jgi:hypothetical protein